MKKCKLVVSVFALFVMLGVNAYGSTVAHWDMADTGAADGAFMPGNGERLDLDGDGLPSEETPIDTDDFRIGSTDLSGNGNHLTAWQMEWMLWTAESRQGDFGMVPNGSYPAAGTDSAMNPYITGVDVESITPAQWTIEAIFKTATIGGNMTIVGRDGRNVGGVSSSAAALYFSMRGDDFAIDYKDVTGGTHAVQVADVIAADTWYHAAAMSDGTTLSLYLNGELIGTTDMTGTSTDTSLGLGYGTWSISRGMWADGHVDRFDGIIDEVRISDSAEIALVPYGLNVTEITNDVTGEVDITLNWNAAADTAATGDLVNPDIVDQYVFVGTGADPNLYYAGATGIDPGTDPASSFTFSGMADTAYYMAVVEAMQGYEQTFTEGVSSIDEVNAENIVGFPLSFTTAPVAAYIIEQPERIVVAEAGSQATFSVVAGNADTYNWYKEDDAFATSLSSTDTLTVDAALANEGSYICEVSDSSDPANIISSEPARLMTKRLAGYWKLDGSMADSVAEEVPGALAHDGFMTEGDPNYVSADGTAGISGDAMKFFNDAEYMLLPDTDFFNYYTGGFTFSFWYRQDANVGWRLPMHKFDAGTQGWLFGAAGDGGTAFIIENNGAQNWTPSIAGGEWHMLTATYDPVAKEMTTYVDGIVDGTVALDMTDMAVPANPVAIGGDGVAVDGAIDEVRMYSYALTESEVAELYTGTTPEQDFLCVEDANGSISAFDFNEDCRVNLLDLADFASVWMGCNRFPEESCQW